MPKISYAQANSLAQLSFDMNNYKVGATYLAAFSVFSVRIGTSTNLNAQGYEPIIENFRLGSSDFRCSVIRPTYPSVEVEYVLSPQISVHHYPAYRLQASAFLPRCLRLLPHVLLRVIRWPFVRPRAVDTIVAL